MDPFTQRMLERARARQEKIDQKLASSGQTPLKRKPLTENLEIIKTESAVKSPSKTCKNTIVSPRKSSMKSDSPLKSSNRSSIKTESPVKTATRRPSLKKEQSIVASPQKGRNDVVVTKTEFKTSGGSGSRRNSDVSLEINIMHSKDIHVDVQIEESDAPMSVIYDSNVTCSNVIIKEIEDPNRMALENVSSEMENKTERAGLRTDIKSRLDRLGNLYSDKPTLSSPIHRTELEFSAATPPKQKQEPRQTKPEGKKKFGRFAALADQINNWEDDLTHYNFHPETSANKAMPKHMTKQEKMESSTLDVSIHSISDINKALQTNAKATQPKFNAHTFTKPNINECQQLQKQIVAELEGEGYRRVSASKSRLVYDFTATEYADHARQEPRRASTTPSEEPAPDMATMVASAPPNPVTKKPSIKKYRAPTPPHNTNNEDEKDKENNVVQNDANDNGASDCIQTKPVPAEKPVIEKGSPVIKKLAPKLNCNVDRSSVLSKAAMFEAGSPRAKDPAEMSLRERKALFEKNKGAAIIPKAPFGMAPSVKTLHGDNKDLKSVKTHTSAKTTPTKSNNSSSSNSTTNSKDNLNDDNISQSSIGGGIRGKLAALFNKEQTISETTIANKFKQEREKEMEMLQNRFHYKPNNEKPDHNNDSDDDQSDHDPSEKAPLMGSALNLANSNKKPEIISNAPKVTFDEKRDIEPAVKEIEKEKITTQPVKRRSSQSTDSPIVLSVLEDVKRIKVNNNKKEVEANGVVTQQPSLYPHLSDIETDNSHTQDEYSDCGGSSTDERGQCNSKDNLNKSDNWAETSFGREVMNVVKKNNTSYQKAVRESLSDSSEVNCDSELDDMLDEALNEDGPTPPKVNKQGSISSSTSFVYQERAKFKSPQKPSAPATVGTPRVDRGNELVHSVSFYRRMQNASSTPSTPVRIVRHTSPEREPATPDEPSTAVTTVRQRIRELQQEVAKQQTVISQASQALNLCAATIEFSGSTEQAEGERLLLLATHRRQACLHEIQRLQVEGAGPAGKAGMATLHIDSITVPLRRDYMRQLNADGATGHHVVCLLKCRDRVLATSMQLTQPTAASLHFPDEIRMDGLAGDFHVTIEVYMLPASKEFLPHEVKYHITNKKSSSKLLTPKSKVSELKAPRTQSPGGPLAARSPQFQPHGYCIFALPQASRRTFTLSKLPAGSPLEGSLTVDMKARLLVSPPPPYSAFLTAFEDVSGLGAWHRRWFKLRPPLLSYWRYPDDDNKKALVSSPPPYSALLTAFEDVSGSGPWHRCWFKLQPPLLSYWRYPDDDNKKPPIGDIDLSTVISDKVIKAPRDVCARPNTLLLECEAPCGLEVPDSSLVCFKRSDGIIVRRHLLAADTPEQRDKWLESLNRALEYCRCTPSDER